jgi:tRNA(Ile)-lysidine synthase
MLNTFQQFIEDHNLCSANDKVLIALSGGLDSVALLMLFLQSEYHHLGIAHCNFQLRGEESNADEDFVRLLASELKVKLFVKSCDAELYAKHNKLTIQEAARHLRYDWFEEVANRESFDKIAVAHHADDQIETFFINLFRSAGSTGLKGMPLERGKIIRPLLFATRKEIEKFASENKLRFREDSSNASVKYLRNKIRHQLLPVLEEVSPQAKKSITNSLQYLQEDALLLNQFIDEKKSKLFSSNAENQLISIRKLNKLKPPDVWLYYLLKEFGFSRDTTNDLASAIQNRDITSSGKIFHSEKYQLLIDRKHLFLQKKKSEKSGKKFLVQKTDLEVKLPVQLRLSTEKYSDNYRFENKPTIAYFDQDKLKFPLTIRKWKTGDRFFPFGMKGSKLISDYFIDNKINRFTKENTWLLLSVDEIIWIIGHRASEKYRVGKACQKILKIQVFMPDVSSDD